MERRSTPKALTSIGIFPADCTASVWKWTSASAAMRPISSSGDGAELVVAVHDSDKNGFGPDGAAQLLEVNLSFVIGRQIGDAHAFFFESLAGVEDGFVFDGGGDHVLGGFAGTHSQEWLCHNSKDGVVV